MQIKSITVFCGSSMGLQPIFKTVANALGQHLATNGIQLVYGGAKVGLMGELANGAIQSGGKVIGVLPQFLSSVEIAHKGLSELILVDSMHERKAKMAALSDGFIALPGGFGTLEELFEILTWGQLGLHKKPIGILNVGGFYDALMTLLDTMVANGLLKKANRNMLLVADSVDVLLSQMATYQAPTEDKWLASAT